MMLDAPPETDASEVLDSMLFVSPLWRLREPVAFDSTATAWLPAGVRVAPGEDSRAWWVYDAAKEEWFRDSPHFSQDLLLPLAPTRQFIHASALNPYCEFTATELTFALSVGLIELHPSAPHLARKCEWKLPRQVRGWKTRARAMIKALRFTKPPSPFRPWNGYGLDPATLRAPIDETIERAARLAEAIE